MKKAEAKLNLSHIGFMGALFYLCNYYHDALAISVFWWITLLASAITFGLIMLVAFLPTGDPKPIHPVTFVFDVITTIMIAWMTFALGFTFLGIFYCIVSVIAFIVAASLVRA